MLDALVLRGMAARTQESYVEAVSRLARYYRRSPESLTAEQVQQYLLHLVRERHLARASVNQYGCAFRFLYGTVLGLDGQAFQIPLAPQLQRLPQVLSRAEVAAVLTCAHDLRAHVLLSCAYGLGLRVSEPCALRVEHIDSAADRMCVHVVQGAGRARPLRRWPTICWRRCAATGRAAGRASGCSVHAGQPSRAACAMAQRTYCRARDAAGITARWHPHLAALPRHPTCSSRRGSVQPGSVAGPQPCEHHHALPALCAGRRARPTARAPLALLAALPALPMH
jgi:site-specific recombinase XerD